MRRLFLILTVSLGTTAPFAAALFASPAFAGCNDFSQMTGTWKCHGASAADCTPGRDVSHLYYLNTGGSDTGYYWLDGVQIKHGPLYWVDASTFVVGGTNQGTVDDDCHTIHWGGTHEDVWISPN